MVDLLCHHGWAAHLAEDDSFVQHDMQSWCNRCGARPGGKAMAISPDRSMSLASSVESMASLHGADLVWAGTA